MVNPALPPGTPSGLVPPWMADPQMAAGRQKQGQLTFAATMAAVTGGCNCDTCKLLRRAVAVMVEDVTREVAEDAPNSPPPA